MIEYKRPSNTNLIEICIAEPVTDTDLDSLAAQFIEDAQQRSHLCILEEIHSLEGINPLIFWKDPRFGFVHVKNFTHAAIVVEAQWVELFHRIVESISTAEIRVFEHTQIELAREWLTAMQSVTACSALTVASNIPYEDFLHEKFRRRMVASKSAA